jgi:hypothetical protein
MPIEEITPVSSVAPVTNVYSQAAADKSLEIFLANKKAIEDAQADKDAKIHVAEAAQAAKDLKIEAAEDAHTAKDVRIEAEKDYQAAKDARIEAEEDYQTAKDARIEEAKADTLMDLQRAERSARSGTGDISHKLNSQVEADQAIASYQANRADDELAESAKTTEAGRLTEAAIEADSNRIRGASPHINLMD